MTVSLYSIAIFVTDIDRAVTFYRDTLGWPVTRQGSFGAEFFEDGTHIGVHPANHPAAKAMVGRETGITLRVDGLLHYCGELMAKGVRFVKEPTQQSFGIMAMIADPDGNVFALWDDKVPEGAQGTHP
ncbi:MAG: VOC family protein [Gemmatimonadota bacterium]